MNTPEISIIVPVYKNQATLAALAERIQQTCQSKNLSYELIFVDDHSPDQSWITIQNLSHLSNVIKGLKLVKNFGQHTAVLIGFLSASGRWVLSIDADLQDLPEHIPLLYESAIQSYQLVFGGRCNSYQSSARMATSWLYRLFLPWIARLPKDAGMFFILERNSLRKVIQFGNSKQISLLPMLGAANLPSTSIPIPREFRKNGVSAYTFRTRCEAFLNLVNAAYRIRRQKDFSDQFISELKNNILESTQDYARHF